jgi:hypothetical protein
VLLDRYRNGNGTNNATDDGTSAGQNEGQYEGTHARMDAKPKETMAKIDAETKTMRNKRMEANRESDQEELKGMMEEMNTKVGGKQEEMLARMREDIKYGQAEMRSTLDEWLMDLKDGRKETTACSEATETKLDPGSMQSIEEHQDIPKGEAAVMPVGEPRKRRRGCNLAAERRQRRKERIQEEVGCRLQEGVPPCKSGMAKGEHR